MEPLLPLLQPSNWLSTSMPSESSIPTTFNAASSRCGEGIIISSITKTILSSSDRTNTLPPNISEIISTLNESKVSILPVFHLMVVPLYQNLLNLFLTLLFMILYTISVNTPNDKGEIDVVEGFLFAFALGFFFDEVIKMYFPTPFN